jgi:hypothetical protein
MVMLHINVFVAGDDLGPEQQDQGRGFATEKDNDGGGEGAINDVDQG